MEGFDTTGYTIASLGHNEALRQCKPFGIVFDLSQSNVTTCQLSRNLMTTEPE